MVMTGQPNRWWESVKKNSGDLAALGKYYEVYNRTDGKSPKTVSWYNQALRLFYRYLVETGKPIDVADLGEPEVRQYILYLQGRRRYQWNPHVKGDQGHMSPISIQTHVRALRAFFSWLAREGYTDTNRLAKLRPPKAPVKVVDVLKPEEITRVLKSIDSSFPNCARNYAILVLFLDSGLRCGELRSFTVDDISMEGGYIKVMGKGGKERIVPFGASAQKALLRYLTRFRPQPFNPIVENFFLTPDGKSVTANCVKMVFNRIARKSGVKRLHPHLCRHTFATNYLVNGGDVFSLQQILGHTTLEMVGRYVTLASSQVTIQHRKFSPMDRLGFNAPHDYSTTKSAIK